MFFFSIRPQYGTFFGQHLKCRPVKNILLDKRAVKNFKLLKIKKIVHDYV